MSMLATEGLLIADCWFVRSIQHRSHTSEVKNICFFFCLCSSSRRFRSNINNVNTFRISIRSAVMTLLWSLSTHSVRLSSYILSHTHLEVRASRRGNCWCEWLDRLLYMQPIYKQRCYRSYLNKYGHDVDERCSTCRNASETAEHVFFTYPRYENRRNFLKRTIESQMTPDNVVNPMLSSCGNWYSVCIFAKEVLTQHRIMERARTAEIVSRTCWIFTAVEVILGCGPGGIIWKWDELGWV